jgi:hypothetical protein
MVKTNSDFSVRQWQARMFFSPGVVFFGVVERDDFIHTERTLVVAQGLRLQKKNIMSHQIPGFKIPIHGNEVRYLLVSALTALGSRAQDKYRRLRSSQVGAEVDFFLRQYSCRRWVFHSSNACAQ